MTNRAKTALFALMTLILAAALPAQAEEMPSWPPYALEEEIADLDAAIESVEIQIAYYESLIATYGAIPVYYLSGTIQRWQYEVYRLRSILAGLEAERAQLEAELAAMYEAMAANSLLGSGPTNTETSKEGPPGSSSPTMGEPSFSSLNLPDLDSVVGSADATINDRTPGGSSLLRDDDIHR